MASPFFIITIFLVRTEQFFKGVDSNQRLHGHVIEFTVHLQTTKALRSAISATDEAPVKFRWKMQILLLGIALIPLTLIAGLYHLSTLDLGNQLAANSQEMLTEKAANFLQRLVIDYGRILSLDKKYLELTLQSQAREVERRLAASPPPPHPLFIDGVPDRSGEFTGNLVLSDRHFRVGSDGQRTPMLVNYQEQVFFLPPGIDAKDVSDDMNRLTSLSEAYQFLYNQNPEFLLWIYTGLDSGLFTSYPGIVGISKDFDPRKRTWYQRAREQGALVWVPPYVDVFTRSILLTLSMPVHGADGSFAGVVGLDVTMQAMFEKLQLPPSWARQAETFIVVNGEHEGEKALQGLAQQSYQSWTYLRPIIRLSLQR